MQPTGTSYGYPYQSQQPQSPQLHQTPSYGMTRTPSTGNTPQTYPALNTLVNGSDGVVRSPAPRLNSSNGVSSPQLRTSDATSAMFSPGSSRHSAPTSTHVSISPSSSGKDLESSWNHHINSVPVMMTFSFGMTLGEFRAQSQSSLGKNITQGISEKAARALSDQITQVLGNKLKNAHTAHDFVTLTEAIIYEYKNSLFHGVGFSFPEHMIPRSSGHIDAQTGNSFLVIIPANTTNTQSIAPRTVFKANREAHSNIASRYGSVHPSQLKSDIFDINSQTRVYVKTDSLIVMNAKEKIKNYMIASNTNDSLLQSLATIENILYSPSANELDPKLKLEYEAEHQKLRENLENVQKEMQNTTLPNPSPMGIPDPHTWTTFSEGKYYELSKAFVDKFMESLQNDVYQKTNPIDITKLFGIIENVNGEHIGSTTGTKYQKSSPAPADSTYYEVSLTLKLTFNVPTTRI